MSAGAELEAQFEARGIITRLRDGGGLSPEAARWFAQGLASGAVSDAQAGAFAMAVLLKPTPTDWDGYLAGFQRTWKVLRAGSFPDDEARDASRAKLNFTPGLNPAGVARQMVAILASGSRRAPLAVVRVPTLVIYGDADPLVPLACGMDTAQAVPGAKLVVVKAMGHALPISMWPTVIDAIASHAV